MNIRPSWLEQQAPRPPAGKLQAAYAMLRHGTRVSRHLFSMVGAAAVLLALAAWLMPGPRHAVVAWLAPSMATGAKPQPQGGALPAAAANNTAATASVTPDSNATSTTIPATGIINTAYVPSEAGSPLEQAQRFAPGTHANELSAREQELVTNYLSRRYRVAQQAVRPLVSAASSVGHKVGIDPLLLLAVMGIESGFNPYAQSNVGAQGLMQVLPQAHQEQLKSFGGSNASLNPMANVQVGARVLKDCIVHGGSLEEGLRLYVGASTKYDGGYGAKVLAERNRLHEAARKASKEPAATPMSPSAGLVTAQNTGSLPPRTQAELDASSFAVWTTRETSANPLLHKAQRHNAYAQQRHAAYELAEDGR